MVPQGLHTQQAIRSLTICTVSRKVEAGFEACSALSLKLKQDYLIFFTAIYDLNYVSSLQPRKWPLAELGLAGTMTLDFTASRTNRNKFLFFCKL